MTSGIRERVGAAAVLFSAGVAGATAYMVAAKIAEVAFSNEFSEGKRGEYALKSFLTGVAASLWVVCLPHQHRSAVCAWVLFASRTAAVERVALNVFADQVSRELSDFSYIQSGTLGALMGSLCWLHLWWQH